MVNDIMIEDKRIKAVKDWPKLKSLRDIMVFLDFFNFYKRFLKNFNRTIMPYILIH